MSYLNFFINEILQDVTDNRQFRILWIDDENKISYIIDLNDDKALPVKRMISEMKEDIITGNVIKLKGDPFIVNAIEEYTQKHIDSRDQAWQIIKEMVTDEPGIYEKNIRTAHIKKATEIYGVSYPTVRKYLCKYWQRGKTINALLPDYQNSGARGKERTAGTKKRGRPPKYATIGTNVDEKTKKLFRVALKNII